MTSKNNDDTEGDLDEPSSNKLTFEETNVDEINEKIRRSHGKRFSGIWTLPSNGYSLYKRTILDRFTDVCHKIGTFFKKSIDFLRVFVYNVYCKHKHHERINTVNKTDNTKSKKATKEDTSTKRQFDWSGVGRVIMGLGLFLLTASEILATLIIVIGTGEEVVPKIAVLPIAVHAFYTLIKVFVKSTQKGDK